MKKFEELKSLVLTIEEDAKKAYEKGNKSAGTRLRKNLQTVRSLAGEIRKEVIGLRND